MGSHFADGDGVTHRGNVMMGYGKGLPSLPSCDTKTRNDNSRGAWTYPTRKEWLKLPCKLCEQ